MENLQSAYAQAIALHQELQAQLGCTAAPEEVTLIGHADELVRMIGNRWATD